MKPLFSFLVVLCFSASAFAQNRAPVVTNVNSSKRAGTRLVDITYDVFDADGDTLTISVQVSADSGKTFYITDTALTDVVRAGIRSGTGKVIVWDAGKDYPNRYGTKYRVKVIAYDNKEVATDGYGHFVYVPADSFQMGDNFNEGNPDEKPVHTVSLNAYYIGKYEVTNAEYKKFIDDGGYTTQSYWIAGGYGKYGGQPYYWNTDKLNISNWDIHGGGIAGNENFPVAGISWYEASAYCIWLSAKTGKTYRLPTEAEWEKASRGTDQRRYPWGNTLDGSYANYPGSGDPHDDGPTPVDYYDGTTHGSFSTHNNSSPYGAYDMAGNVMEWCYDWYDIYSRGAVTDPTGPSSGNARAARGGAWGSGVFFLRSASRSGADPYLSGGFNVGFRCLRNTGYGVSNIFTLDTRTTVGVEIIGHVPAGFELYQNYPNPFNSLTKIRFSIPKHGNVEVNIYGLMGNHIWTLHHGYMASGIYEVEWHGTDKFGQTVSSGTYFYQVKFYNSNIVRKMQFIK